MACCCLSHCEGWFSTARQQGAGMARHVCPRGVLQHPALWPGFGLNVVRRVWCLHFCVAPVHADCKGLVSIVSVQCVPRVAAQALAPYRACPASTYCRASCEYGPAVDVFCQLHNLICSCWLSRTDRLMPFLHAALRWCCGGCSAQQPSAPVAACSGPQPHRLWRGLIRCMPRPALGIKGLGDSRRS